MKNKKILLLIIIFIEFFFTIYLLNSLQNEHKFLLVTEPLNKSQLIFINETDIKYFFEPIPNKVYVDSSDFLGKTAIATTNNDSLFERYNYSVEKSKDVYRIISLGDSFTEGMWVNTSNNYSEKLEDILNNYSKNCKLYKKIEVINLGVGAYDILYSTIRFEKRGLKYKPDLVIWFLKYDDFAIIAEIWMKIVEETQFPDKKTHYEEFSKVYDNKTQEYFSLLQNSDKKFLHKKYIIEPLKDFFEITKNKNITVIIFFQHSSIGDGYDEMLEKIMTNYYHVSYLKLNIDFNYYTQNLSIFYNKEDPIKSDFHPNEEGHKIIALDLFNHLKSNLLKNC